MEGKIGAASQRLAKNAPVLLLGRYPVFRSADLESSDQIVIQASHQKLSHLDSNAIT